MSRSDEQWAFMKDLALLILYADSKGYKLTFGEVLRTKEQQGLYLERGMSKTPNSMHLVAQAADINYFFDIDGDGDKDYIDTKEEFRKMGDDLGKFWNSLNPKNQCGLIWKWDRGHFERRS